MRPIYRLGVAGKRFAVWQIRGGKVQQNRWRRRHLWPVAVIALAILLLFFFEWLGSEQPQKWVETPIDVPAENGSVAKRRR
jgi:hypothetical protein